MKYSRAFVLVSLLMIAAMYACNDPSEADQIITKAINTHGGEQYSHAIVSFKFRDRYYRAERNQGKYKYESIFQDSLDNRVHDWLTNEGYGRELNGETANLSAEDSAAYANTLNSVIYFALLPYFLNDPAAHKELVGQDTIKGSPYYEVKVSFAQESGGKDHHDTFMYWIHQQDYTMDYFAYEYATNGGGTRFREAFNTRGVNGIRFADYINYESTVDQFELQEYDSLFEAGKVKEFSRIKLENIEVENIEDNTKEKPQSLNASIERADLF